MSSGGYYIEDAKNCGLYSHSPRTHKTSYDHAAAASYCVSNGPGAPPQFSNSGVLRMLLELERCYGLGMDALVTVILEHELYCGLGMDALVAARSWNTHVIIVWAWMLW